MKDILDSDQIKNSTKPRFNAWLFLIYVAFHLTAILFITMQWTGAGILLFVSTSSMFVYPLTNLIVFGFDHIPNNIVLFVTGVWYFFNLLGIMNWRYVRLDSSVDVDPFWMLSFSVFTLLFFIPHMIHRLIQRKKRKAN